MKNRKLLISILSGIMAGIMLLGLILSVLPSSVFAAQSSDEIKEQIDRLEQQQNAIGSKMEKLLGEQTKNRNSVEDIVAQKDNIDQQISLLSTEIHNIDEQIQSYSELIVQKQEELEEAEAVLADLNSKNQERIRAMEEAGKISYWSVLFKAKSFTELLDRLNLVEEIQKADQRRLEELSAAAQAVEEARTELEEQKSGLETSREEQVAAQTALDEKRTEADEILLELNARESELADMYEQYEAEKNALVADIAAAEKAYTEAKRQEQEASKPKPTEPPAGNGGDSSSGGDSSGGGDNSNGGDSSENKPTTPPTSSWVAPCAYTVMTSPYGWRTHPITGKKSFHNGVDLANNQGTPIYAAKSGTVTSATYSGVYGYYVTINHGDGFSTLYGHMTNYIVSSGETVSAGQLIGYMGSTGLSSGPHLHFTVYYNGNTVNPMDYI